jgi:hypothetical protein
MNFLSFLSLLFFFFFSLLYFFFGFKFIRYTILYHLQVNIKFAVQTPNFFWQYFSLGFFSIFILLISLVYAYFKKDYKLFLFSVYPLFYDFTVITILRQLTYHYFAFILPFVFISFGRVFSESKFFQVKFFLSLFLFLSLFSNFHSLTFYFDKNKNIIFEELVEYTFNLTKENDMIFGSAIPTNYISFVTNRKIVNNYFDSDLKHISFEGVNKVINDVKEAKPKIIIADKNYYKEFYIAFEKDYEAVKSLEYPGYYSLLLMKRKE